MLLLDIKLNIFATISPKMNIEKLNTISTMSCFYEVLFSPILYLEHTDRARESTLWI